MAANPALLDISGFANLKTIGGDFYILNNTVLATISGFTNLTGITGLADINGVATISLCQTTDTSIANAVSGIYTTTLVTINTGC